jgi:hypothetical protein
MYVATPWLEVEKKSLEAFPFFFAAAAGYPCPHPGIQPDLIYIA